MSTVLIFSNLTTIVATTTCTNPIGPEAADGVQWIGQKDSNFGQADVSIDGVFKTMVDCYNPTNQY
jgi:hypothetical protein